jgi:hypothetical protein
MGSSDANAVPMVTSRVVSRFHVGSARVVPEQLVAESGAIAGVLLRGVNALDESTWPLSLVGAAPAGQHVFVATGWATAAMGDTPAWLPRNRPAFDAFAVHLARLASEAQVVPTLVPFAKGVLSDSPSTLTFLRGSASKGWRFVLSPADMWTPEVAANGVDHLLRLMETIAMHEAFAAWVMPTGLADNLAPGHAAVVLPENVQTLWQTRAQGNVITV